MPGLIGLFTVLLNENLDPEAPLLYGMETSWLLDPSIPLTAVVREHTGSPARQPSLSNPCGTS